MTDSPRAQTPLPAEQANTGTVESSRLTALEQAALRALRRLDFRPGRERTVLLHWNGTRWIVLDTVQV